MSWSKCCPFSGSRPWLVRPGRPKTVRTLRDERQKQTKVTNNIFQLDRTRRPTKPCQRVWSCTIDSSHYGFLNIGMSSSARQILSERQCIWENPPRVHVKNGSPRIFSIGSLQGQSLSTGPADGKVASSMLEGKLWTRPGADQRRVHPSAKDCLALFLEPCFSSVIVPSVLYPCDSPHYRVSIAALEVLLELCESMFGNRGLFLAEGPYHPKLGS